MSNEQSLSETFSKIILRSPEIVWNETYFPFGILTTIHAIFVSFRYKNNLKETKVPWLQGLFAVSVMGVGGSSISNLLIGEPPSWLTSNSTITTYWFVYLLMSYFPSFHRIIETLPSNLLNVIFLTADGIVRAISICSSGVDNIRYGSDNKLMNSSWVAMLICGSLCGCGGGILDSAFNISSPTWTFSTPKTFIEPTYDMKTSFYIALFYALTTTSDKYNVTNFTIPLFNISQGRTLAIFGMVIFNLAKISLKEKIVEQKKVRTKKD